MSKKETENSELNDKTKYVHTKLTASHPHPQRNHIYVTRKSPFPALLKRAKKLLFTLGFEEIEIYGLGAAIPIAISLSLELKKSNTGTLIVIPSTYSVTLVDEYIPLTDDLEEKRETRVNSAIKIKIQKIRQN